MLRDRAIEIVRKLTAAGHQAVFAGGCVRDRLLDIEPLDYDIATSARPAEIESLFPDVIPVGKQFGILVVPADGHAFEVATFRTDGPYLDGRHPTSVEFTDARSDAARTRRRRSSAKRLAGSPTARTTPAARSARPPT